MRRLYPLLLAVLALLPPQPSAAQNRPTTGQLTVDVVGLRSDRGKVFAALYRSGDGFPNKIARAVARKISKIVNKQVRLTFEGVPAGDFAISLFHDENANNTLDTSLFGMPSEGWGTSRDAKASFGPPAYADARLPLSAGEHKRIVVHVQY